MASFSKNYVSQGQSLSGSSGVPDSVLQGISPQYIITIVATYGTAAFTNLAQAISGQNKSGTHEFTVNAFLQDKITLHASSTWNGITQSIPGYAEADKFGGTAEFASQSVLGRTTITPLTTRRMWAGSDPISLHLKLKFEAFNNAYQEVILPCMGLQSLTLPRGGGALNTAFLIPPGPSPFDFNTKGQPSSERTENIFLSIGGFLNFSSVIIKNVNVSFENRMSTHGPIGAEVDMVIETYQMLTREDLMKISSATAMLSTSGLSAVSVPLGQSFIPV